MNIHNMINMIKRVFVQVLDLVRPSAPVSFRFFLIFCVNLLSSSSPLHPLLLIVIRLLLVAGSVFVP